MADAMQPVLRSRDLELFYNRQERGSLSLDYRPEFTTNSHKIVHEVLCAQLQVGTAAGPRQRARERENFTVLLSLYMIGTVFAKETRRRRDLKLSHSKLDARRPTVDRGGLACLLAAGVWRQMDRMLTRSLPINLCNATLDTLGIKTDDGEKLNHKSLQTENSKGLKISYIPLPST